MSTAREPLGDPASSRETQTDATRRLPMAQLRPEVQEVVHEIVDRPSFFRRMPTETIDCDPQLFKHLVRYPEVIVNIWELMGITQVETKRTGPFSFIANDGVGTTCKCDLLFSNEVVDMYVGRGVYQGTMTPRAINGKCICVLHSSRGVSTDGKPMVTGTMDIFLKLDNLGADLVTRTLAPFVGKTADYNFVETAKFISQISQVCERSPDGAEALAGKLDKLDPPVRDEFARIAARIGTDASLRTASRTPANRLVSSPPSSSLPTAVSPTMQTQPVFEDVPSNTTASDATVVLSLSDSTGRKTVPPVEPSQTTLLKLDDARSTTPVSPSKPSIYMRR